MTLNIAHRGFSALYPENTMLAFTKAKEQGLCDGIELDVQLTKDNVPIIIHDEDLERTTGQLGKVKDFTYREIRTLNAGNNQKIPSLEEYLEFAKSNKIYTNIELKNSVIDYKDLELITLNLIYKFGLKEDVIISSFNHESMIKVKNLDKNIKTGLLYDNLMHNPQEYCKTCNSDAMHPNYTSLLISSNIEKLQKSNIDINAYTVNDENHMRYLVDKKITSIITNHPDILYRIIKGLK